MADMPDASGSQMNTAADDDGPGGGSGVPVSSKTSYVRSVVSIATDTSINIGGGLRDKTIKGYSGVTSRVVIGGDDEEQSWGSKLSYVLTLVGYAVGFGNIWRFPHLMQQNGGVVFLFPYFFMLAFLGIPMFFLEIALGQRLRKGSLGSWNEISPYLAGVGIMNCCICLIVGLYYNTLIAWCLRYLFDIFRAHLRWETCSLAVDNDFESTCDQLKDSNSTDFATLVAGETFAEISYNKSCILCEKLGPSQYYWFYEILNISDGIDKEGIFNWKILVCLVVAWFTIWAILVKGIKATGKVVYFTALFPYVVLTIFFVCGLSLPGMENGFRVLFTPRWNKLFETQVWLAAGTQIFFSLGLGFGVLIAFASYLPATNDCFGDALNVAAINCGTSIYAAIVIFTILGFQGTELFNMCAENRTNVFKQYLITNGLPSGNATIASDVIETFDCDGTQDPYMLAGVIREYSVNGVRHFLELVHQNHTTLFSDCIIDDFVRASAGGTGLVFIVFAQAMVQLPVPQIWAFLFYAMLFTLGIDSAFSAVEGAIACFTDLKLGIKRWLLTTIVCIVLFCFSMIFTVGWGEYLLTFFDEFTANWILLMIAFCQCVGISYVYGLKQFAYDIKLMTGHRPSIYLMLCWKFLSPTIIIGLIIASIVQYSTPDDDGMTGLLYGAYEKGIGEIKRKEWPSHVVGVGFGLLVVIMMWVPLGAFLKLINFPLVKASVSAYFPEDELREERKIISDEEEAKGYSTMERMIFWGSPKNFRRAPTTAGGYKPEAPQANYELEGDSEPQIGEGLNDPNAGDSSAVDMPAENGDAVSASELK